MSQTPTVAVCAHPFWKHLNPLFDALCDALVQRQIPFRRFASHEDLLQAEALLSACEVIACYGGVRIGGTAIAAAPRLRGIVSCVSGVDGIDLPAATAAGVLVAHAPTQENVRGMAEAAVLLMLHLVHRLDDNRAAMRSGAARPEPLLARSLEHKTVGLVGWGRISTQVAALLQGWGVRLLVHSRRPLGSELPAGVAQTALAHLMAESDVVCVLAAAEPSDPPLLDRALLACMKPSAYLVNLARGSIIDESALVETLEQGRIAGAALDVFVHEPLPRDARLLALPNVILTPHRVGHTREGDESLAQALQDNVLALVAGRVPPMVRNPAALPAWQQRLTSFHRT